MEKTGASGWLPKGYVEEIHCSCPLLFGRGRASLLTLLLLSAQPAKALYAYAATSADELSFEENDTLVIVDSSDPSWWKAEKDGVIAVVPATYLELSQ